MIMLYTVVPFNGVGMLKKTSGEPMQCLTVFSTANLVTERENKELYEDEAAISMGM